MLSSVKLLDPMPGPTKEKKRKGNKNPSADLQGSSVTHKVISGEVTTHLPCAKQMGPQLVALRISPEILRNHKRLGAAIPGALGQVHTATVGEDRPQGVRASYKPRKGRGTLLWVSGGNWHQTPAPAWT